MKEESLIVKATKKYKYDVDNVRFSIKYFVEDFNAFFKEFNRPPLDHKKEEHALYLRWHKYRNYDNLNAEEIEYFEKYIVKMSNVSWLLQKFVNEFNAFYERCNRFPTQYADTEEERSIYSRYRYYTNRYLCNKYELQLLKDNNIIPNDNVRRVVKKFVQEYNTFVIDYGRKPNTKSKVEKALCGKYARYTNPDNLNDDEIRYVDKNLLKPSKVRESVKKFVKECLELKANHIKLSSKKVVECFGKKFYHKYWFYTNALNLNNDEIRYLQDNDIDVRNLDKMEKYNRKFEIKG